MKQYNRAELTIVLLAENEDVITASSLTAFAFTDAEGTDADVFSGVSKFVKKS